MELRDVVVRRGDGAMLPVVSFKQNGPYITIIVAEASEDSPRIDECGEMLKVCTALGIFDGARPSPLNIVVEAEVIPAIRQLQVGVVPDGIIAHLGVLNDVIASLLRWPRAGAGRAEREP